jgi:hypothetical protein
MGYQTGAELEQLTTCRNGLEHTGAPQQFWQQETNMSTGINFTSPPVLGSSIYLDDQRYELEAVQRHIRRDGRQTFVLTWRAECPRCGQSFVVTTGLVTKALNRRCEPCRVRARSPVSGRGRKHVVGVRIDPKAAGG